MAGYICTEFVGTLGGFGPSWQSWAAIHFKLFALATLLIFALPVGGILGPRLVSHYQRNNGPQRTYYANGDIRTVVHRKGGVLNGISEHWNTRGEKIREQHYKDGHLNGVEQRWEGTQVTLHGEWNDGFRTGVWEEWHANGSQKSRGRFELSEDGLADLRVGAWQTWDDAGAKLSEGNYAKDVRIGEWHEWYPSGQDMRVSHYGPDEKNGVVQQGSRVGFWREWHENGQLRSEGTWGAGAKQGPWKEWYSTGQPRFEGTRVDGRSAVATSWNEDGSVDRIIEESSNRYGQTIRISKVFYRNGKLKFIAQKLDAQFHGLQYLWFANGLKREEGEFYLGQKHGTWTYWNHKGEQLGQEDWSRGELTSDPVKRAMIQRRRRVAKQPKEDPEQSGAELQEAAQPADDVFAEGPKVDAPSTNKEAPAPWIDEFPIGD